MPYPYRNTKEKSMKKHWLWVLTAALVFALGLMVGCPGGGDNTSKGEGQEFTTEDGKVLEMGEGQEFTSGN